MYSLEHEGFTHLVTTEAERNEWWLSLTARVTNEVELRGGSSEYSVETYTLTLMPPYGYSQDGEIKLRRDFSEEEVNGILVDHHICFLTTGLCYRQYAEYVNYEEDSGILSHVLDILDGKAFEAVYVKDDGSWVGTGSGSNGSVERYSVFSRPESEDEPETRIYKHALTSWLEQSADWYGSSGGRYGVVPSLRERAKYRVSRILRLPSAR